MEEEKNRKKKERDTIAGNVEKHKENPDVRKFPELT